MSWINEKDWRTRGKKYLRVGDYTLNKALDKIKKIIGIKKFDDTKILTDKNDKLPNDITLKNVSILVTCVINDNDKFYPQMFLEEANA